MKRKVVKHGPSTLILSLPSHWVKEQDVHPGDELDVKQEGNDLLIAKQIGEKLSKAEIDITDFDEMIPRTLHSLYKKGLDEIRFTYDDPNTISLVEKGLRKETIGFEILESGNNSCTIKNVSEGTKEFEPLVRQTFWILLSMAEDGHKAMVQGDSKILKNLIMLETTNNRLTTVCRRYLNTKGANALHRLGPQYYIVEQLEKIADTLKYLYQYLHSQNKIVTHKDLLGTYKKVNSLLRDFYNLYYKFEPKKMAQFKKDKDGIISDLYRIIPSLKKPEDIVMHQHLMLLVTDIFSMNGPYLILVL